MKTTSLPAMAALALLAGAACHAQIDEPTLVLSHPLGVTIPGVPVTASSVTIPPGGSSFPFSVGDITVDQSEKDSELTLNSASLVMTSGTADFSGVTAASLAIVAPASSGLSSQALATYDRTRDGAAARTLVMKQASQVNLLPYLESTSKTLGLQITVSGTAPETDWTADLDLDLHVLGKVTFP